MSFANLQVQACSAVVRSIAHGVTAATSATMSAKDRKQALHGAPAMSGLPPEGKYGQAQLNIENIFNKGYWASADANNNISPGQPRTFRFKLTARL